MDASFKAIEALINSGTELQLYSVNNITSGTDSQGEVTVRLQKGGRIVNGQGADTDIVIASAKAYVNALNKIILPCSKRPPTAPRRPFRARRRRGSARRAHACITPTLMRWASGAG